MAGSDSTASRFGEFRFDPGTGVLERRGEEVHLPPRAIEALRCLLRAAGGLVSREELEAAVCGDSHVTRRSVPEAILVLRRALGDSASDPRFIQTVPRRGYRFIAPVQEDGGAGRSRAPDRAVGSLLGLAGLGLAGVVVVLLSLAWSFGLRPGSRDADPFPVRANLGLGAPLHIAALGGSVLAIAPDGTRLAHVAREEGGGTAIRIEDLSRRHTTVIDEAGSRPTAPFFSADGTRIGFVGDGFLYSVDAESGRTRRLCRVPRHPTVAADWATDGNVVFSGGPGRGLRHCEPGTGLVTPLSEPAADEWAHRWPRALADGRFLLAVEPRGAARHAEFHLAILDPVTGETRVLARRFGAQATPVGSDRVVVVREGALAIASLDLDSPAVGTPRALPFRVSSSHRSAAQFAVAADGTLVHAEEGGSAATLTWVDPDGSGYAAPGIPRGVGRFDVDAAGRVVMELGGDLQVWNPATSSSVPAVEHAADDLRPVWGASGSSVYFASNRSGPYDLYRSAAPGPAELLLAAERDDFPTSVTPGEEALIFVRLDPATGEDVWSLPLGGDGTPRLLVGTEANERDGRVSPDGRWLAFVADDSGCPRVYALRLDGAGGERIQVSSRCAGHPMWAADGGSLGYRRADGALMVAAWHPGIAVGPVPAELHSWLPGVEAFWADRRFRRVLALRTGRPGLPRRIAYVQAAIQ